MENWIIYWLIWGILIWVSNFYSKVVAHKKINKHRILLYSSFSYIIFSATYLAFNIQYIKLWILLFILIAVRIIAAIEKNLFIIEWLRYLETGIFYPLHKIIHVFLTFFVWMILFWEYLSNIQILAVLLWIVVILLLTSKENRKIQIDYKKWIFFLILSNVMILMSSSINKYIAYINFDISVYMLFSWIIGSLYLLVAKKDVHDDVNPVDHKDELRIGLVKWFFTYFWFVALLLALRDWPFVLVQLVHTSSIFIPIVLATIIYKEKINFKKVSALILFLLVIYLINL
jgi:hypothetical protein